VAPQASRAACATSSGKDKKNKIPQEQRPPQSGLRALTPRTMPVVCVNLCSKSTEVVGSYAGEIAGEEQSPLERRRRQPGLPSGKATRVVGSCAAYSNGKREASGDRRGNPKLACPPSRSTVAFELLRRRRSWRPCPPVWRRHSEQSSETPTLRQQHRRNGEPSSGYAPSETAEGTDVWPPPTDRERFCKYPQAACSSDRLQFSQGVSARCPRPTALRHERPAAPQLTTAFSQRLMFSLPQECTAAVRSNVYLPCRGLPMISGSSYHLSFCGGYSFSITSMEESVNVASFYPYHIRPELIAIRVDVTLKSS